MFPAMTRKFSKNLLKIKGNSSSFGFAIEEFPSDEAIETIIFIIPLCILLYFALHYTKT